LVCKAGAHYKLLMSLNPILGMDLNTLNGIVNHDSWFQTRHVDFSVVWIFWTSVSQHNARSIICIVDAKPDPIYVSASGGNMD